MCKKQKIASVILTIICILLFCNYKNAKAYELPVDGNKIKIKVAGDSNFPPYEFVDDKGNYRGFLSKDISVKDLILHKGDVHHVFPRDYLKKNGLNRGRYNQVANYVIMQSEINIQIGNKPPKDYMDEMRKQCESKVTKYGNIIDEDDLINNLRENCIPEELFDMGIEEYDKFLDIRRRLIAERIEKYYKSL